MTVQLQGDAERFVTRTPGLVTRHAFSFGSHYDPHRIGHALLVAHNEDTADPGAGYPEHPHRDLEIVTWVLAGALRHEDSQGRSGVVTPGVVQRMSAGSGVRHSEWSDAGQSGPTRFVQMWVRPTSPGGDPSYAQADVAADLAGGELVPLVADGGGAPVSLHSRASLYGARLAPGARVRLPDVAAVHLFVAAGAVELEAAGTLHTGDTARLTAAGPRRLAATRATELLVWAMPLG
jgi:redox-sensitive bicupin YhaK (pirin superfamily)